MTKSESNFVVVTGATGFIGQSCCKCLKKNGHDVIKVGRSSSDDVYCDLAHPASILDLANLPNYKAFVHLGAHVGLNGTSLEEMYLPNVVSTALIADLARQKNAHLIFASTVLVAGLSTEEISASSQNKPDTPYAKSKELAEFCIEQSGVSSVILRIGGVFGYKGPGHLGLNRTIQQALLGKAPQIFGTGSGKRNYIYVGDLSAIIVQAIQFHSTGTHLVSGREVLSIAEMYQLVCDIFELNSAPRFSPGDSSSSQVICSLPGYTGKSSFSEGLSSIRSLAAELS